MIFSKRIFPKFRILTNYILRISKTQTESVPGAQMHLCLENNNLYLSWIFGTIYDIKIHFFWKSARYRPGLIDRVFIFEKVQNYGSHQGRRVWRFVVAKQ